jgi:hypothetical protein
MHIDICLSENSGDFGLGSEQSTLLDMSQVENTDLSLLLR